MVIDKSNMKQVLTDFPKQCREALSLAQGIKISDPITKILVAGLGGSGIGGNILQAFMATEKIPVHVVKDYDIPAFVDDQTLVFAVSYSGNTEETLSAVTQAKNRGSKIVAITSGGKLADLVDTVITVPTGLQPRNAVGYLFLPMVGVLFNSSIVNIKNSDLNEMIELLSDVDSFDEKGRELAKEIKDKTPIIFSTSRMEPAAYRFKCEINENAKHPSYHHVFPELCHNELVGIEGMERSKFVIFLIRNSSDHERNRKRMTILKDLFEEHVDVVEVPAMGDSFFAQLFSIIYLGDWVSYHLALWKRVDPTPVHVIENLKQQLKE